jgi:phosphatidylserine decarboxylase
MTIHKEGYLTILITILFIAALNLLVYKLFPSSSVVKWSVYIFSFLLFIIVLQFFRSPIRKTIMNENHIIAPADGKVVVIEEVEEPEYFKDKRIQVSIFMSPVNVHVNRYPIGGVVKYAKYHPGQYLVAWHPKSSTLNERTSIVVEQNNKGAILFRQIAGALARRIVFYSKEGEVVTQGSEFGFIKFGSRVDLFLPKHAVIKAKLNQKVVGGETVIAEF